MATILSVVQSSLELSWSKQTLLSISAKNLAITPALLVYPSSCIFIRANKQSLLTPYQMLLHTVKALNRSVSKVLPGKKNKNK